MWWAVAQAVTALVLMGVWLRAWKNKTRVWQTWPTFAAILATLALPFLVIWPLGMSPLDNFWYFVDFSAIQHLYQSLSMMLTAWVVWLVWKYRRQEPTLAALVILMAIYLPIFTYLGWHYTLTGAFIRGAIWWPIVFKLALCDARGWRPTKFATLSQAEKSKARKSVVAETN